MALGRTGETPVPRETDLFNRPTDTIIVERPCPECGPSSIMVSVPLSVLQDTPAVQSHTATAAEPVYDDLSAAAAAAALADTTPVPAADPAPATAPASYDASQIAAPASVPVANEASASGAVSPWPVVAAPNRTAELEPSLDADLGEDIIGDSFGPVLPG